MKGNNTILSTFDINELIKYGNLSDDAITIIETMINDMEELQKERDDLEEQCASHGDALDKINDICDLVKEGKEKEAIEKIAKIAYDEV